MKILSAITLLLALAIGGLGYINYRQAQDVKFLQFQISSLSRESQAQHTALVSHKKAIVGLKSNQKEMEGILVFMIQALEPTSSPKSEHNSYTTARER